MSGTLHDPPGFVPHIQHRFVYQETFSEKEQRFGE